VDASDGGTEGSVAPVDSGVSADANSQPEVGGPDAAHCAPVPTDGGIDPVWNWAQWPMPNSPIDIEAGAPNPPSYTDNGDGTVTDNVTELMWQQSVPKTQYDWHDALSFCSNLTLAGRADWRLPFFIELASIEDYSQSDLIDPATFPGGPGTFWSATADGSYAVFIAFAEVGSRSGLQQSLFSVRCVRAATSQCPEGAPNRYTIGSGTVYDEMTKLTWQQIVPSTSHTWGDARSYCSGLMLDGTGWRLPTEKELLTLIDAPGPPAIDVTAFPAVPPSIFWSATPGPFSTVAQPFAWWVSFHDIQSDFMDYHPTSDGAVVRCVR
jgi:hypothetical protein